MTLDSRTAMERRFVRTQAIEDAEDGSFVVRVGNERYVEGLSQFQADAVLEALRYAQKFAVRATQYEMRIALGLEGTG